MTPQMETASRRATHAAANAGTALQTASLRTVLPHPHEILLTSASSGLYAAGDATDAIYEVVFGAVRLYRVLSDGRRQISAFYVAGEAFGFEAGPQRHFFADAVCDTAVRAFPQSSARMAAPLLLPLVLTSLVRAQDHMLVIGRQTADERLAALLLDLMERQGTPGQVDLPMPRADIADYLGLTIETVSRTFSRFRRAGFIELSGARTVHLRAVDTLRRLTD